MNTAMNLMMPWMLTPTDMQRHWEEFCRKIAATPKVLEVARKVRVGVTPSQTVYRRDTLKLNRYISENPQLFDTPLLCVFALVNRPYILDLKPGKSVVAHFVNGGFDTYKIDWGVPSHAERFLNMEDYIEGYMNGVVDFVRERTGSDKINLLGYCMGGSMSAMYTALHQDKIKNLILMAAPIDWSNQEHLLARWTDAEVFDVDRLIDVCGNAPAEMLQGSFMLLKPVSTLVEKYFTLYDNMENEKFLEDFFAMETWLNDNIPVAGEMFREFVKYCMQQNRLIKGELKVGTKLVNLKKITCPVLNLAAEQDHLVPCGQSLPLEGAIKSDDYEAVTFPAGHIGLAVGSKANRELWPKACQWLGKRSEPLGS